MVVTEHSAKSKETWKFLEVFTKEMWLMMAALHIFMGFVIWLIERQVNEELKGLGSMLWFLVTVIFFAHSKSSNMSSNLKVQVQKSKISQLKIKTWVSTMILSCFFVQLPLVLQYEPFHTPWLRSKQKYSNSDTFVKMHVWDIPVSSTVFNIYKICDTDQTFSITLFSPSEKPIPNSWYISKF